MSRTLRLYVFAACTGGLLGPAPALADEDSAARAREERPELPILVLEIGAGVRFRNIHLEVGDGAGGSESRSFETGAYFDFAWHLLLRPMARRPSRPSVQAILLQLDGGSGIALRAEVSGIELQTNTWRMLGQFGYLYPVGRLQLGGLVGVGGDVFGIDLNSVLPSSRIIYARLGPALCYSLVPRFLSIRADFGLRFPFYFGALEDAFGDRTSGIGLDAALTVHGWLNVGFSYAVRFVWEHYYLRFSGSSMNVPAMGDGGDGNDHALTIQFLLGWSL
ncbi:MAG: hypothetical protein KJO40_20160 [Deltaproteobacteria bacterium]|nr:hypothetical protein [Deltaproteobacteria bacterium]MBT8467009.1 hypothetical protein [Deltaproteobacteria bacterium]NNK07230.1 hypothetical protein [Myxococcales bacterium]NNK41770.1 hypothetical protein [Myxococcales bacterium]RZV54477.1 MAG: hypothetical protein EX268_05860 [Deltaproteobacteria bacterium]